MAQQKPDDDFFGFDELLKPFESDLKAKSIDNQGDNQSEDEARIKTVQSESFKPSRPIEGPETNFTKSANENDQYANLSTTPKKVAVTYGDIRYDDFNRPLKHGQFDKENETVPNYKKSKKMYDHSFDASDYADLPESRDKSTIAQPSRDQMGHRRSRDSFHASEPTLFESRDKSTADQLSRDTSIGPKSRDQMGHRRSRDTFHASDPTLFESRDKSTADQLSRDSTSIGPKSRDTRLANDSRSRDDHYRSIFDSNMKNHRAKFGLAGSFGRPRELIEAQNLVDSKFGPDKILNKYKKEVAEEIDDDRSHVTSDEANFDPYDVDESLEPDRHMTIDDDLDQSGMSKRISGAAERPRDQKENVDWAKNEIMNARDFIDKLRQEKEKEKLKVLIEHDRDGSLLALQKIWSFIPDLYKMTKQELIDLLVKSVIFNENGLIAIDKPFGLPTIGGTGVAFSLSSLLEDLRKILAPDSKHLHLVHRLDKSTTGALMIATNESTLKHIKQLIAERKLTKTYWCITKGVPEPPQGVIKIPLGQCDMGHGFKWVPLPKRNDDNKDTVRLNKRERFEAITEYKVLSSGVKCSLVETRIVTGVTHQIRSHLGFGLNCPVLGDHKYSNFLKMLPQRLPGEVLQRLGIRSSKSRHLPIYLHAKEIIIPEFSSGKNAFIRTPVPNFFLFTLKKLKLIAR